MLQYLSIIIITITVVMIVKEFADDDNDAKEDLSPASVVSTLPPSSAVSK